MFHLLLQYTYLKIVTCRIATDGKLRVMKPSGYGGLTHIGDMREYFAPPHISWNISR